MEQRLTPWVKLFLNNIIFQITATVNLQNLVYEVLKGFKLRPFLNITRVDFHSTASLFKRLCTV